MKVWTPETSRLASAARQVESMPLLRNTPTGTSAIRCFLTLSSNRTRTRLDDGFLAEIITEVEHRPSHLRAVQHHAERAAYAAENLQHLIDEWVMLAAAAITVGSAIDYLMRALPEVVREDRRP